MKRARGTAKKPVVASATNMHSGKKVTVSFTEVSPTEHKEIRNSAYSYLVK